MIAGRWVAGSAISAGSGRVKWGHKSKIMNRSPGSISVVGSECWHVYAVALSLVVTVSFLQSALELQTLLSRPGVRPSPVIEREIRITSILEVFNVRQITVICDSFYIRWPVGYFTPAEENIHANFNFVVFLFSSFRSPYWTPVRYTVHIRRQTYRRTGKTRNTVNRTLPNTKKLL